MYSKGVTTSEIADLIEKMYGPAYTSATISNITKAVTEHVQAFHSRSLNKRYSVMVATMMNIRRDSISKESLHILIGITPEGTKEVLDYRLYPQESSGNYREMLQDIKNQGCEEILLFVIDGLVGLANACIEEYPLAKHQTCWVHIQRGVARLVRAKDRKEVLDHLKEVYRAKSKEEALEQLELFKSKLYKRYPKVINNFEENSSLFSFYDFPSEIRSSIYTTNLIEGNYET